MKLLPVPSSHVKENSLSSINGFVKWSKGRAWSSFFSRKFMCVKKQDFYIKRQLSYKNIFCKKTAFFQSRFLQKYIFIKKLLLLLSKNNHSICKKIAFLHKNDAVLQEPFFMQHIHIWTHNHWPWSFCLCSVLTHRWPAFFPFAFVF